MSHETYVREDVRLILLRALHEQDGETLSDTLLLRTLEAWGHRKSMAFVRNELRWLEREASALELREMGDHLIAILTQTGADHVERRIALEGVARPSRRA